MNDELDLDAEEPVPLMYRVLHWPLAAVQTVFDFALQYVLRRPWSLLPSAALSMLAAVVALSVGMWLILQPDSSVVARIESQFRDAVDAEDLARQRVCLKALMQRSPGDAFARFRYALLLIEDGDVDAGQQLLEQLASEGDAGYAPAHRRLAEEALTRYGQATDPAGRRTARRTAIRHLEALGKDRGVPLDYRLGMLYAEDGDVPLAEVQLRRAAKAGYGAAQMMLSRLQLYQGDAEAAHQLREEARESLEAYIADHPEDLEARITWARCLLDGAEWKRFGQVLGGLAALETDADYRDRLGILAITASRAQRLASPLEAERAVEYARFAFALLLDRRPAAWRLLELAAHGTRVRGDALGEIRQWLDQTADDASEDASLWFLRARLAELNADVDAADDAYGRASELDANFLRDLAGFYRRQGRTDQLADAGRRMCEHFEPLLDENPDNATARIALAEVYADRKQWKEAQELLSVADPPPQVRITLAETCVRQFDAQQADPDPGGDATATEPTANGEDHAIDGAGDARIPDYGLLRAALRAVPSFEPALSRLEDELFNGSQERQEAVHRMLLDMIAGGEQPAAIHRLLGIRTSEMEDWAMAAAHFEQAVLLRPNDALLRNNLAYSLYKTEQSSVQLRRASLLASEALELAPGHPEILATRGEIRVALKDYQAATEDLERALASLKQRTDIHDLLATCYEALGMDPLAETHRSKAREAESQDK